MKITHIAIWAKDIEQSKEFYVKYFNGTTNEKYTNPTKGFESYFITFGSDCQLEIMQRTDVNEGKNEAGKEYIGLAHFAFSFGSPQKVDEKTAQLKADGFSIVSDPRTTGDGFYESTIADPDGNRIEVTE